jgi:hypothetical protein
MDDNNYKPLLCAAFGSINDFNEKDVVVLEDWEALKNENGVYTIKRNDGQVEKRSKGESIKDLGTLSIDRFGNLTFSEGYKIYVGQNIEHSWVAWENGDGYCFQQTSKDEKNGYRRNMSRVYSLVEGETVPGLGIFKGVGEDNLPIVGDHCVKLKNTVRKFSLNVYEEKLEDFKGGYSCSIKTREGVSEEDGSVPGVFFPRKKNRPAAFYEFDINGELLCTLKLWPSESNSWLSTQMRSPEDAAKERVLEQLLIDVEQESVMMGVPPEENYDYVRITNMKAETVAKTWDRQAFFVSEGHSYFGVEKKKLDNNSPVAEP